MAAAKQEVEVVYEDPNEGDRTAKAAKPMQPTKSKLDLAVERGAAKKGTLQTLS